ncbi:MAG: HEPN domain-containing protein [Halobacteriota archaeon]
MREDRKAEATRWLTQAEEEYKDAYNLMQQGRYYLSLFLCQQSAEKALKAFIYLQEDEPLFTHSVAVLLRIAREIDPDFEEVRGAKRLDDYYIPTRYPNGLPGEVPSKYYDDPEEAKKAVEWTKKILQLVRKKIEGYQNE